MKPILTISVLPDGSVLANSESLGGDELLDAVASGIAGLVTVIEATWASAHGEASGKNAGQCALNRAGKILNGGKIRMVGGEILAQAKPEGSHE